MIVFIGLLVYIYTRSNMGRCDDESGPVDGPKALVDFRKEIATRVPEMDQLAIDDLFSRGARNGTEKPLANTALRELQSPNGNFRLETPGFYLSKTSVFNHLTLKTWTPPTAHSSRFLLDYLGNWSCTGQTFCTNYAAT